MIATRLEDLHRGGPCSVGAGRGDKSWVLVARNAAHGAPFLESLLARAHPETPEDVHEHAKGREDAEDDDGNEPPRLAFGGWGTWKSSDFGTKVTRSNGARLLRSVRLEMIRQRVPRERWITHEVGSTALRCGNESVVGDLCVGVDHANFSVVTVFHARKCNG